MYSATILGDQLLTFGFRQRGPLFIGADIAIKVDNDSFCNTFTTSLAGKLLDYYPIKYCTCLYIYLGAVNGVGDGVFSLFSLACK